MMDRITWSNVLSTWKNVGVSTNQDTRSQTLLTITMESTVRNQKVNSFVSSHPSILSFPLSLSLFTSFSSNCYVASFRGLVTRPSVYSLQEYTWLLVTQVIPLWISIFIMWNLFISRKFIIFILLNIVPQRRAFQWGQPEMRNIFTSPKYETSLFIWLGFRGWLPLPVIYSTLEREWW